MENAPVLSQNANSDYNSLIYNQSDIISKAIPDIPKDSSRCQFTLDFLIKNAKKKFITGINFGGEEENDEKSEGSTNNKGKKEVPEDANQVTPATNNGKSIVPVNNIKAFCKEEYGIYEKGQYVRIDIKSISKEHAEKLNPNSLLILGTINIQESNMGFLKFKFDKHIYHQKILKSNDPLIFSIGWRRFQSNTIYCVEDKNFRLRMIKYTPKYTSCLAIAYGPLFPINIRAVCIQNYSNECKTFRICAGADLKEVNSSFEVMKKLKLIGEPYEVHKKTAFIKGMFNSNVTLLITLAWSCKVYRRKGSNSKRDKRPSQKAAKR